jgi:hypothetical protein
MQLHIILRSCPSYMDMLRKITKDKIVSEITSQISNKSMVQKIFNYFQNQQILL